jgi:hypothetical protein
VGCKRSVNYFYTTILKKSKISVIKYHMRILAVETSCDDTGIAVLEINNGSFDVLSNIVASQIEVHKKYGGVFPAMAKREHQNNLIPTFEKALVEANLLISKKTEKILEDKVLKTILER